MQRAPVTGVAGFIGSHLAAGLLRQGWHVTGVDRRFPASGPAAAGNLAVLTPNASFCFICADVVTAALPLLAEGAHVVFHLAACQGCAVRGVTGSPST